MTAKNQLDSVTKMLVDLGEIFFRNLELIFCRKFRHPRNPRAKNQNFFSRNFTLRASGDALEEDILFYAKNIPNIQVLRAESPLKGGSYKIFWKP
jgi:hypothetical protein